MARSFAPGNWRKLPASKLRYHSKKSPPCAGFFLTVNLDQPVFFLRHPLLSSSPRRRPGSRPSKINRFRPSVKIAPLGFVILGNCSMRCSTSCVHAVVSRSRSSFQTRLYLVHPWTRTSCVSAAVPDAALGCCSRRNSTSHVHVLVTPYSHSRHPCLP